MPVSDRDFFERRERQSRQLADAACDHQIRIIHLQFADRYRVLADAADTANPPSPRPRLTISA